MANNNNEENNSNGFKSAVEPHRSYEHRYVTIIMDITKLNTDMLKDKIIQISDRYGSLRAILFHQLPTMTSLVEEGKNVDFHRFLYSYFHTCISCYPSPKYIGNAHDLIAENSKSADVYVIGEINHDMAETISAMTNREIKMVFVPLTETIYADLEIAFEKTTTEKYRIDVIEKLSAIFEANNIHHKFHHMPVMIGASVSSIDGLITTEQIEEAVKDFIVKEKLACQFTFTRR